MKNKDYKPVKAQKPWDSPLEQKVTSGDDVWKIAELIEAAKDLETMEIPMQHLCIDRVIGDMDLMDFVGHMKLVLDADLSYPIILDEKGHIFDGRHRVAKAILEGHIHIKAVRFEENPRPTYISTD